MDLWRVSGQMKRGTRDVKFSDECGLWNFLLTNRSISSQVPYGINRHLIEYMRVKFLSRKKNCELRLKIKRENCENFSCPISETNNNQDNPSHHNFSEK